MTQETQTGALEGMEKRFKREGIYVHLWLIHVEVWQKTTKFCKAIILQLKKKKMYNQKKKKEQVICLLLKTKVIFRRHE